MANAVLGGWQLSAVYIAQTGQFLTPTFSGADPSNTNTIGGRPDRLADGNLPSGQRTIDRWFDVSAFAVPANGGFGNSGRGIVIGPGRSVLDLGLFKRFEVGENKWIRIQGTATNAFNHPTFRDPQMNIRSGSAATIGAAVDRGRDFGLPREIMLGVRFEF